MRILILGGTAGLALFALISPDHRAEASLGDRSGRIGDARLAPKQGPGETRGHACLLRRDNRAEVELTLRALPRPSRKVLVVWLKGRGSKARMGGQLRYTSRDFGGSARVPGGRGGRYALTHARRVVLALLSKERAAQVETAAELSRGRKAMRIQGLKIAGGRVERQY